MPIAAGQAVLDEVEFGRYRLIEVIGEGAMGKVYKAHDTVMRRDVAIKMLASELAAEEGYRERFQREAYTAARLTEPHVIPIHEAGEIDGRLYLVMPIVNGIDLHSLLERDGPLPPELAVKVIEQLAGALDAAHAAGLVHRDVKPSNALITGRETVYLIDFGIAHDATGTKLTRTGSVVGTFAYMAPERLKGKADARADVYSLACMLHECLTGVQPFAGDTIQEQIHAHLVLDPPRPSTLRHGVPAGFDEVIGHGMAKAQEERYQTAKELATAAREALTEGPGPVASQAGPATAPERPAADGGSEPTLASIQPRDVGQPANEIVEPTSRVRALTRMFRGRHRRAKSEVRWFRQLSRRVKIISGAVILVAAVAAAVGIPAVGAHRPSKSPYSAQVILAVNGLNKPAGVVVTSSYVYVADSVNNRVLTLGLLGSNAQTTLPFAGLGYPNSVAVDSAGNVYVADTDHDRVLKLAVGAPTATQLPFTSLKDPEGVTVDSSGNVYVADTTNNRVLKLVAGSTTPIELPFTGLNHPEDVAVDASGNVYVADGNNSRVLKLAAGSSAQTELPFSGLNDPDGVAVDNVGGVYVADFSNNRVLRLAARSTTPIVLPFSGLNGPAGLAVDSAGDVYVADYSNNRVLKLPAE
jgi:serine/threonine protein kinase, bacterial